MIFDAHDAVGSRIDSQCLIGEPVTVEPHCLRPDILRQQVVDGGFGERHLVGHLRAKQHLFACFPHPANHEIGEQSHVVGFRAVVHLILRLGRGIFGHPVVHAVVWGVTQARHHTEVVILYESVLTKEIIRSVRSCRGKAKGRIRTESDMPAVEAKLFQKALGE